MDAIGRNSKRAIQTTNITANSINIATATQYCNNHTNNNKKNNKNKGINQSNQYYYTITLLQVNFIQQLQHSHHNHYDHTFKVNVTKTNAMALPPGHSLIRKQPHMEQVTSVSFTHTTIIEAKY